ncbi:hypothetical protein ULMS_22340 [Patiriisocius marinistellae]|uniref:Uncharacterized protein n=1 Tax=Patiriisocius marinistellae TaxID=2494560 RepID=A0A5J4G250_9FLAO|nr:hypothetical protein [Patiriisocius marinistellae]GEQ86726.1 hypothetical protein ULMS_22340 [Patiriisocius marinistellae]
MSQRIKMIWDFKGPNASKIASHHVIHLNEFAITESLENTICDVEKLSDVHHIAYMVIDEENMQDLRARLKPNRGQLYKE